MCSGICLIYVVFVAYVLFMFGEKSRLLSFQLCLNSLTFCWLVSLTLDNFQCTWKTWKCCSLLQTDHPNRNSAHCTNCADWWGHWYPFTRKTDVSLYLFIFFLWVAFLTWKCFSQAVDYLVYSFWLLTCWVIFNIHNVYIRSSEFFILAEEGYWSTTPGSGEGEKHPTFLLLQKSKKKTHESNHLVAWVRGGHHNLWSILPLSPTVYINL